MGEVITNMKVRFSAETNQYKKGMNDAKKATSELKNEAGGLFQKFADMVGIDTEKINNSIGLAKKGMVSFTGGMKDTTAGANFFSKAMKIIKMAIVSTGIGALVIAIVAVVVALSKFQNNADKLQQVFGGLGAVIKVIVGRIGQLGEMFLKLVSLDFKGAGEAAKKAFSGMGDAIKQAYSSGVKLVEMQQDLERAVIASIKSNAELNGQLEKNSIIADDATRSFAERQAAAERNMRLQQQFAKVQEDLARRELDIVNEKVAQEQANGTISRELLKEQAEAEAKFIEAQNAAQNKALENEKTRRELKQDLFEKDLDILIDGFDKEKTINEQKIADEKRTFEERRKILEKTKQLSSDSFNKQVETIQNFTGKQIDAYDLLATEDARLLNQKIRSLGLSEIMEGRLLEVLNERKLAVQDLAVAENDLVAAQKQRLDDSLSRMGELQSQMLDPNIQAKPASLSAIKMEMAKLEREIPKLVKATSDKIRENIEKMPALDLTPNATLEVEKIQKITAANENNIASLQEQLKFSQEMGSQIGAAIESSLSDVAVGFGEMVGEMMAGSGSFNDLGGIVLASLGDMAIQVGKIAIATGVTVLGIRKALEAAITTPAAAVAAIAAGAALVAIGTAVKGSLSKAASGGGGGSASSITNAANTSTFSNTLRTTPIHVHVTGKLTGNGKELSAIVEDYKGRKYVRT